MKLKRAIIITLILFTAFTVIGCCQKKAYANSAAPKAAETSHGPTLLVKPALPINVDVNDWEARKQVVSDNPVDEEFLVAYNDFAYVTSAKVLAEAEPNRNFSPISLYYALAIAATGAEGNTFDEITNLLRLSDRDILSHQSGNLFRRLYTNNDISKLMLANSLWIRDTFTVKDAFIKNAVANFYAWVYSADFNDPTTSLVVGQWIAANTNGTIEPQISLNRDVMMLIINTIYFYDEWQDNFPEELTTTDKFTLADGAVTDAEFMHRTFDAKAYYKGANFTRIDLGFRNHGVMSFTLPDEGVNINDFLASDETLRLALESGEHDDAKVLLYLPKFKFGNEFKLAAALKALGINDAFNENANFKALTDEDGIYISDVIQQSHIGVNENGVEAAAYTMVMIARMSLPLELEKIVELKFNRPFIFSIKAENGAILFVGVCDNPAQE